MIKKLKFLPIIFVFYLFISCNSYKFYFGPADEESSTKLSEALEKTLKKEELFLMFTISYNKSKVKIYENNRILFDSLMTTSKKTHVANTFKINVNSEITIYFEDIRKPLKISKDKMKYYKFIYIEKDKKNVIVEFNNGSRRFLEESNYKPKKKSNYIKKDSIE